MSIAGAEPGAGEPEVEGAILRMPGRKSEAPDEGDRIGLGRPSPVSPVAFLPKIPAEAVQTLCP